MIYISQIGRVEKKTRPFNRPVFFGPKKEKTPGKWQEVGADQVRGPFLFEQGRRRMRLNDDTALRSPEEKKIGPEK